MGHFVDFAGTNRKLVAPDGVDEATVGPIRVFTNGVHCVSCWKLDPDELEEVLRTGCIHVALMSGPTQPPIFVGDENSVRQMIADVGVWKRAHG